MCKPTFQPNPQVDSFEVGPENRGHRVPFTEARMMWEIHYVSLRFLARFQENDMILMFFCTFVGGNGTCCSEKNAQDPRTNERHLQVSAVYTGDSPQAKELTMPGMPSWSMGDEALIFSERQ